MQGAEGAEGAVLHGAQTGQCKSPEASYVSGKYDETERMHGRWSGKELEGRGQGAKHIR